ncbi:hypothetical protein BD779DRAFT_1465824 [Infundibulicybe gibba]|nr:hypothetical protein BD779DRAFT_1465824 [Infundibulicybe gibba]
MMAYLSAIRSRTGTQPLRLRVGGNSMDSSIYKPEQVPPAPMVQLVGTNANANNQPVTYGPGLWEVMKKVADDLGGAEYFIGLSLLDPNSTNVPLLAGAAQQMLGSALDSFVLGNEPDLYANHGERPNQSNYTLNNYIDVGISISFWTFNLNLRGKPPRPKKYWGPHNMLQLGSYSPCL